jgi:hypothetical protein
MASGGRMVVSFDIDGTLEMGDPPGPIGADFVRRTQEEGCIIGSCSDRTIREQSDVWERVSIIPDFVVVKNRLDQVREQFTCERFVHIGDTQIDAHFAELAGFEFFFAIDLARRLGRLDSPPGAT